MKMKSLAFDTVLDMSENFAPMDAEIEFSDYSNGDNNVRFEITYYPIEHGNILAISRHKAKTARFNTFTNFPNIKTIHMKPKYIQRKRSGNFVVNDFPIACQEMIEKVFTPSHLYSFVKSQIWKDYDIIYKEYSFSHKKVKVEKFTQSMALNAFDIRTSKKAIAENFADLNKWA